MSRVCLFGCATVPLCPVRLPQSRPSALRSCYFTSCCLSNARVRSSCRFSYRRSLPSLPSAFGILRRTRFPSSPFTVLLFIVPCTFLVVLFAIPLFITKSICSFSGTRCPSMWSGRPECQWGVLSRLAYICHATVCPSLCSFWGGCSAWAFWWRNTSDTLKRVGKDWQMIGMRQPVKANHGLQRKCKKAKVLSIGQWSKKTRQTGSRWKLLLKGW